MMDLFKNDVRQLAGTLLMIMASDGPGTTMEPYPHLQGLHDAKLAVLDHRGASQLRLCWRIWK